MRYRNPIDRRIRDLERKYKADPSLYNFEALYNALERSRLIPDESFVMDVILDRRVNESIPNAVWFLRNSDDEHLRRKAIRILGKEGSSFAISTLVDILEDDNEESYLRIHSLVTLGRIKSSEAIESLIDLFKDANTIIRRNMIHHLWRWEVVNSMPLFIEALSDIDAHVRTNAARALSEIGDLTARPALIEALDDEDDDVRHYAALALGRMGIDISEI